MRLVQFAVRQGAGESSIISRHDHWLVMFVVLASCVRFVSHPTHQVSRANVSIKQQVEAFDAGKHQTAFQAW